MFPFWRGAWARFAAALGPLSGHVEFRIGVASVLAVMHLALFAKAGRDRLDLPFNSAPSEAPYYANEFAPATRGYPREPHHWSRLIVSRWDAQHYIGFALRGLEACPDTADAPDVAYLDCGLGWLPAYGLAGGVVSRMFHLPADVALVVMSVLAAILLNFLWTSRTIVERIGKREAWGALLAFNMFPSAFYVVTPYTEAATLALVLGGFICLANDRWIRAGLLVGTATALRATAAGFAVGLGAAAVVAAYRKHKAGTPRWWRPLVAIPLAGWGQLAQLAWLKIFIGDATAYLRARDAFGDERDFSRLTDTTFYLKGFTAQHMDSVMLIGGLAIIALTLRELVRRFKLEESLYLVIASLAVVVISIGSLHEYWGLNRYLLMCPLIFLGAGVMVRKHLAAYVLWLALCAMIYWHVELCSYITQGHPTICPCLGRFEFGMPYGS